MPVRVSVLGWEVARVLAPEVVGLELAPELLVQHSLKAKRQERLSKRPVFSFQYSLRESVF